MKKSMKVLAILATLLCTSQAQEVAFQIAAPIPHGADAVVTMSARRSLAGARLEFRIVPYIGSSVVAVRRLNAAAGGDTTQIRVTDESTGAVSVYITAAQTRNIMVEGLYYGELWMTKDGAVTRVAKGAIPMSWSTMSATYQADADKYETFTVAVGDTLWHGMVVQPDTSMAYAGNQTVKRAALESNNVLGVVYNPLCDTCAITDTTVVVCISGSSPALVDPTAQDTTMLSAGNWYLASFAISGLLEYKSDPPPERTKVGLQVGGITTRQNGAGPVSYRSNMPGHSWRRYYVNLMLR